MGLDRRRRALEVAARLAGPFSTPGAMLACARIMDSVTYAVWAGGGAVEWHERQHVSIMRACEMVHVSRRTIYNWIEAGKLEYFRTAGGSIRIYVDTLVRLPDGSKLPEQPQ